MYCYAVIAVLVVLACQEVVLEVACQVVACLVACLGVAYPGASYQEAACQDASEQVQPPVNQDVTS